MRSYFLPLMIISLLQYANAVSAQQLTFNHVLDLNSTGTGGAGGISGIAQDRQGYIWLSISTGGIYNGGVYRYDGSRTTLFSHDPNNPNSLANNWAECITVDSSNTVWIGTFGGLDAYDPATNRFTHFKHTKDKASLINDTVGAILEDHKGNLWVGTARGLDLLNKKTGQFTHYFNIPDDPGSLSDNDVRVIYEDRQGTLWVGCGSAWDDDSKTGGLNRFNSATGKFTRYVHALADPNSLANNKVRALLEDSRGNFWVGTSGDGLHIMDRSKGTFTHYYYDSTHPEKLSRPPVNKTRPDDHITFIREDITGAIWIGTYGGNGINRYDPVTKKITHFGFIYQGGKLVSAKDTVAGYKDNFDWWAFTSKDGLLWIATLTGNLYSVNPLKTEIPYYKSYAGNSFYKEPGKNILWIATDRGLIRKDLITGAEKIWHHDSLNNNSLCNDIIHALGVDNEGKFWLATWNGLSKFDPVTNNFTNFSHSEEDTNSLSGNNVTSLFIDHDNNIWIGTYLTELNKLDPKTNKFRRFESYGNDINYTNSDVIISINEDHNHTLWIGTSWGIYSLDSTNTHFRRYKPGFTIYCICVDASGVVWAGGPNGLYRFDKAFNDFLPYEDPSTQITINSVLHILEDNIHNLWVATGKAIVKINEQRNKVKLYGSDYGIHYNSLLLPHNFQSWDSQLFFGDQGGYYSFFPDKLKDNSAPPLVSFSAFNLGDKEVKPAVDGVLKAPVWETKEIKLKYNQNTFSFDFTGIHYDGQGDLKYLFMLENYNNTWRNIGTDHTAYFFNVPPGTYIFHVKVIEKDGTWGEKTISIIITPPWYKTWWAYCLYVLLLIAMVFVVYRFIKQRILEKEREKTRARELAQAKEIEKAYHKLEQAHETLKSTQAQLIQSEKMASLGQLTAGIAHEIQNPLNFVNNFSEVNNELIIELVDEADKGNLDEVKAIAKDIQENEEKIIHHGKRADEIVKGMLQHSRANTGKKEPTDINALADEYLRLSYHGIRAKDKNFNATLQTDFDNSIGKINIVPQDMARVLLNLLNNAFYAVGERRKADGVGYEPVISVCTKRVDGNVEIHVKDNGIGIPQKVVDKIFQPFFTTKPAGQGTGLGLSLAYDIIKAHGGEIKVETKEGEGSEFIIQLPN